MTTKRNDPSGTPARRAAALPLFAAGAAGLLLLACESRESPAPDASGEGASTSNTNVYVPPTPLSESPKPGAADSQTPEPAGKGPVAATGEFDASREFLYVDESTGEERRIPLAFKSYPEWGPFVYNDQLVRHHTAQMDEHGDDPAVAKEHADKVAEFAAKKTEAFEAMENRFSAAQAAE